MKELTIVWQRARSGVWEDEWVEYLFRNIPHRTIENLDHTQFIDNSIIVDAICWAPYHNSYINEMSKRGYKFGLVHLTDESIKDDISSYNQCKFVLRNYYREQSPNNVVHIPLGWNTGFVKHLADKPSDQRQHTWVFVGERWDQNRNNMVSAMSKISNGGVYVANHTGPRLAPSEMGKFYNEAIFVPCPRGALIIDSFRVTEALEAGCIPIVEQSDYWFNMHGPDFPAIQIDNWSSAPDIVLTYLRNPAELEKLRTKCRQWWIDKKHQVTTSVTDLVIKTMYDS